MPPTVTQTAVPAVEVFNLNKTSPLGRKALNNINLRVMPGEMVALIGASESGKSTLLRHIAGLMAGDKTNGTVKVLGQTVQHCGWVAGDTWRIRARLGFVFQQFNLVGHLPVLTNVLGGTVGRIAARRSPGPWFTRTEEELALEALTRVGMAEFAMQRSSTLSRGQQQRVAIARALVQKAEIILADDPNGSLDPESSRQIMDMLSSVNREKGITVLVSLHQVGFVFRYCPRTVALGSGLVVYDGPTLKIPLNLLHEIFTESQPSQRSLMPGKKLPSSQRAA
jgi:phosphonate transport system ATP-binding protein